LKPIALKDYTKINNQITAPELQVIDDTGKSLGVLSREDALRIARESELDLIEIAPTAKPPVAKIMEYGKFQYQKQKKERDASKKTTATETKGIRVQMGTSPHDLALKAKKISEFLKDRNRVRIDMILRGRAKYMDKAFIKERLGRILTLVEEGYKISEEPKQGPRGISVVIEYDKNK
jgi:translation initiation factor IF-3